MSRSSGRGQLPVAALVAVACVGLGLSLYAGVLESQLPGPTPRDPTATLDRIEDAASSGGVLHPNRLSVAPASAELRVHARLITAEREWTAGSPLEGTTASRRVAVRVAPGRVRPGTLEVTVA
ncbi:DUF7285 family protein [Natronomonas sp. EA1]|uniref:DUF7285 family protein n=1 Tax=Natronomonas sp. EA1 TaxID=3421655 RepID=UPI003EBF3AD8